MYAGGRAVGEQKTLSALFYNTKENKKQLTLDCDLHLSFNLFFTGCLIHLEKLVLYLENTFFPNFFKTFKTIDRALNMKKAQ